MALNPFHMRVIENPERSSTYDWIANLAKSNDTDCKDSGLVIGCLECCNPKIENKDLGLCASCNKARRDKAKKAMQPKKKPKAPKKVSDKRKAENAEYTPLRLQFLADNPECQMNFFGCTYYATQVHHCSMSHRDFLNLNTWKSACDHCHKICERELSADERKEMGLLISSPSLNRDVEKNII